MAIANDVHTNKQQRLWPLARHLYCVGYESSINERSAGNTHFTIGENSNDSNV
jgi:hypothetical protein